MDSPVAIHATTSVGQLQNLITFSLDSYREIEQSTLKSTTVRTEGHICWTVELEASKVHEVEN